MEVQERKTAHESMPVFEELLHKLVFGLFQPIEDDGADGRHTIWGRFPP